MDSEVIAVLIGVLGALFGVYLKEYLHAKAKKRRSIVILRSNVFLFLEKLRENEHFSKLLMAGSILDKRYITSLESGDDSKYKELLSQIESIEKHANSEEFLSDSDIDSFRKTVMSFSDKEMDVVFEEIDRFREEVENGSYILGNSDIDSLDASMVHRVFQFKRSVISIIVTVKILLTGIRERDEIDPAYVKSQVFTSVKEAILACRHVMPLMKMCNDEVKSWG